jgi:hypothetical protein
MIRYGIIIGEREVPAYIDHLKFRNMLIQLCAQAPEAIESSTLEVKNWCNDEKELAEKISEAAACLANWEGGTVLIGVGPSRYCSHKFSACPYPNVNPEWLAARVHDHTVPPVDHVVYDVSETAREVLGVNDVGVFALEVARTTFVSGHMTVKGVSKIRVGKECRPYYTAEDDRTRAHVPNCTIADLSLTSIRSATALHRERFGTPETRWSDPCDFLLEARLLETYLADGESEPRHHVPLATLILFGKHQALSRHLPFFETLLIDGGADRHLRKNVVDSVQELCGSDEAILPSACPGLSRAAAQELLLNSYIHRCYRTAAPNVIKIRADSLEVQNPGELVGGLNASALIHCVPVYRNLSLADGARFIGLCDKIGHGIDLIYKSVLAGGFDFPVFESGDNLFTARISTGRSREFAEFVRRRSQSLSSLEEIAVLRLLWAKERAELPELATAMERGHVVARRILEEMRKKSMVERCLDDLSFALAPTVRGDIENIFQSDQMDLGLWG